MVARSAFPFYRLVLTAVLAIVALGWPQTARTRGATSSSTECLDIGPLINSAWEEIPLGAETLLGTWKLPISHSRPEIVTEARMTAKLARSTRGEDWILHGEVNFKDPSSPYGLPFTFPLFTLEWSGQSGVRFASLDWSEECSSPGISVFPGGKIKFSLRLLNTADLDRIERVTLHLWGSRN